MAVPMRRLPLSTASAPAAPRPRRPAPRVSVRGPAAPPAPRPAPPPAGPTPAARCPRGGAGRAAGPPPARAAPGSRGRGAPRPVAAGCPEVGARSVREERDLLEVRRDRRIADAEVLREDVLEVRRAVDARREPRRRLRLEGDVIEKRAVDARRAQHARRRQRDGVGVRTPPPAAGDRTEALRLARRTRRPWIDGDHVVKALSLQAGAGVDVDRAEQHEAGRIGRETFDAGAD